MLRREFFAASVLGALALRTRATEAGPCAPMGWHPYLWTPDAPALPPDGALLVSLEAGGPGAGSANTDYFPSEITLRDDRGVVPFTTSNAAPTVRLLRPNRAARGALSVAGVGRSFQHPVVAGGPALRVLFDGAARPAPAAPALASVTVRRAQDLASLAAAASPLGRTQGPPPPSYLALLNGPPPADAAFLVVAMATRPAGRPFEGFCGGFSVAGQNMVTVFAPRGRCGPPMLGSPPSQGASVVAAWIDRYGRLSPPSAAVTVTGS
jgi:hypothetical protein